MRKDIIHVDNISGGENVPLYWIHTLIIGSGAAGLNAAVQLARTGINDVMILTEGLSKGISINTGGDKQTYYKLSISGQEDDSPGIMAESYLTGGSMHAEGITPIKRWGQPEDIGKAIASIAQDYLPFSTGQVINVDGGFHIQRL